MNIVLLGGSSFSTPALFASLSQDSGALAGSRFTLVGRDENNLRAVLRASRMQLDEASVLLDAAACRDAKSCVHVLARADLIIIQLRAGGLAGRKFDEEFPLRFDICGDEGLGPGGLSAAWRTWPEIKPWLSAIAENAPAALVLLLTSPVGILMHGIRRSFPRLRSFGLCEVPWTTLQNLYGPVEDGRALAFDYLGVNHLGWLSRLSKPFPSSTEFPTPSLIEQFGAWPTKYLRLELERERALAEQRTPLRARSEVLRTLAERCFDTYGDGDSNDITACLNARKTPWYSHALAPLILGLHTGDSTDVFFLTTINDGYCPQLPSDATLEMPWILQKGTLTRRPLSGTPPPAVLQHVSSSCQYEALATEAVLARSQTNVQAALGVHPWLRDATQAANLAKLICQQNQGAGVVCPPI